MNSITEVSLSITCNSEEQKTALLNEVNKNKERFDPCCLAPSVDDAMKLIVIPEILSEYSPCAVDCLLEELNRTVFEATGENLAGSWFQAYDDGDCLNAFDEAGNTITASSSWLYEFPVPFINLLDTLLHKYDIEFLQQHFSNMSCYYKQWRRGKLMERVEVIRTLPPTYGCAHYLVTLKDPDDPMTPEELALVADGNPCFGFRDADLSGKQRKITVYTD